MDESESRSDRLCAKYLNGPICVWLQPLTHAQRVEPLSRECAKVFGNAEVIRSRSRSSQGKARQGKAFRAAGSQSAAIMRT
jgi:hypothetical protein